MTTQNTELRQKINELEQQNAELVTHCEHLKECCYMLGNGMKVDLDKVNQTPQQSLAKHDVEVLEGALSCVNNTEDYNNLMYYKVILGERVK